MSRRATSSKAGFKSHVNASHGMMRDFRCDLCNYTTIFTSKLEWHKKHIHTQKIRKFPCDKCKYSAITEYRLRDHKETVHENIRAFKCPSCDHAATNKSNIDKHIKVVHEKIKEFGCQKCSYSASSSYNLEQHIKKRHANQIVSDSDSGANVDDNVVGGEDEGYVAPMQTVWLTDAE